MNVVEVKPEDVTEKREDRLDVLVKKKNARMSDIEVKNAQIRRCYEMIETFMDEIRESHNLIKEINDKISNHDRVNDDDPSKSFSESHIKNIEPINDWKAHAHKRDPDVFYVHMLKSYAAEGKVWVSTGPIRRIERVGDKTIVKDEKGQSYVLGKRWDEGPHARGLMADSTPLEVAKAMEATDRFFWHFGLST